MDNILEECAKLPQLQHPNVMEIVGECIDQDSVPFVVMPFMSNVLLQYLKTNRKNFFA